MKITLNIEPKPQSRPRFARRGRGVMTYEDRDMKIWRNRCRSLIANLYTGQPVLEGALRAKVRFFIKPPLYKDDGQIAEIHAAKVYSNIPRIEFEMEEIDYEN